MRDAIGMLLGVFCVGLVLCGLFVIIVGVMSMIDPVGTQMANDADPFGEPPTLTESLWRMAAGLAAVILGGWLCVWLIRRENAK
jgi:hypothetical protein